MTTISDQAKPAKTPVEQITGWLQEQNASCLWQLRSLASFANSFALECYALNARVFILQIWSNGGVEVYGTLGDPTIVGTIEAMKIAGSARPLNLQWGENTRDGDNHVEWHAPCGCAFHSEPFPHVHPCSEEHKRPDLAEKEMSK